MDKRKLSAIQRDEATADMMDIARRLGSIHYIVTARLIEDEKILLLNFFEVSTLKKGKAEAAFRTFLSDDDYITQDLKQSKVKWLTASLYNMDTLQITEIHWNSKKKEYEREDKVFIHSNEEQKIIEKFFEKYRKIKSEQWYSWPEPWQSVRTFQDAVLERRLMARHKKELEVIDAAMDPIKEAPNKFFEWAWETGMSFSRYVLYKEIKKGEADCECTYCNQRGLVSRKEVRLRNNEKGACPFCGSPVTFKARGKLAARNRDERWFVYVDPTTDGFVFRYFHFIRILQSDSYLKRGYKKTQLEEYCHELVRTVYSFKKGEPSCEYYEWNVYKQRGSCRWCSGNNKYMAENSILYPGNMPVAWEHTPMKYSALEVLSSNIPTVAVNYEKAINAYLKFPKLEWLNKMGLNNLAKHVIEKEGGRYAGGVSKINYEADTIYEILGLTKVNIRVLQQIDGGDYELRLLQVAQQMGMQFKPQQLKEYYETFECNTDLLKSTKRKVSLHKIVKYISKESERYPMGERGGCWQYSYMRYKEREDPRIERKRNCAHDWLEYIRWCKELKYDLDNLFIYMPNNFKAVHDRTAKEYQELQDKKAAAEKLRLERKAARELAQTKKAMKEIFSKNEGADAFSINGKGLILVVPKDGAEIKAEGEALHHCVGGYVERVAKGETSIFFIRKEESPDKPYFTMEWRDNQIIQCRGMRNCGMPPDVKAFVKIFEQKMLEAIKKGDINGRRKKQNLQSA